MRRIRLYVDTVLALGAEVDLPQTAADHVIRVLRLGAGTAVTLFNGDGSDYAATLGTPGKRGAKAVVHALQPATPESPLAITLAQGIARGDKMDWILQKATELGVARIVPLITARTEVRLDTERSEKRMAHWRGVIASACEQCGRAHLPDLEAPRTLADWAADAGAIAGLRLRLDPEATVGPRELPAFTAACLAIGPEGGLAPADRAVLTQAGFTGLRLGPRVLRTETAGLAALAVLQALHGDF